MLVRDVMSVDVCVAKTDTPLSQVACDMASRRLSCLLIVDCVGLCGIITERDLTRYLADSLKEGHLSNQPVSELMTPKPLFVRDETPLSEALMISRSRNLRHLPVLDKKHEIVGLITQSNIVEACFDIFSLEAKLQTTIDELQLLCLEDALLGIPNRRAMEADLSFIQSFSARHDQVYSVALIDVDYFKPFNDNYGHQAGDQALQAIASALNLQKRDSDRLFRYGGEEFLVSMQGSDVNGAVLAAERLRESVASLSFPHDYCPNGFVSVSIGVAQVSPKETWDRVVENADKALYRAKTNGRNRVEAFLP